MRLRKFPVRALLGFVCLFVVVLFLTTTLLVAPVLAQSTGTLLGKVLDASTNKPLIAANIRVLSVGVSKEAANTGVLPTGVLPTGISTDFEGRYQLVLNVGTYEVAASFVGYETSRTQTVKIEANTRLEIDFSLQPADYLINPITVTASRRPEKLLEAPASITVLEAKELEMRTALTATSHLASVPGVDLITTGLVSSRIVIRGFNDNLATSLLTLVDNRIAAAPSVRLTALQLIPMTSGDLDQIEVVSGPASALYGPNAANGVVHMITKSPFDSKGTSVSFARGQQDVALASFRHAGVRLNGKFGYKIAAQYYSGTDFEYTDPEEIEARSQALQAGAISDTLLIGRRDFGVKNLSVNTRLDYRFSPTASLILNAGVTRGNNIEITPTGAAQVENARISYGQLRFRSGRLFAQTYANLMNSGASYFLRTGQVFRDVSRLFVAQVQHYTELNEKQRFTYGLDGFYTIPQGEGTINGRNEKDDNVTEVGLYLQSETRFSDRLTVVGAARGDYHDKLGLFTFSPRAAIVFKPGKAHTTRFTFNQAFRTPLPNDLFSDLLGRADVFTLGRMESFLGFAPTTDLRVQGMQNGFHFDTGANGLPRFRSPFAPLDPRGLSTSDYIDQHDPVFTNVMWDVARQASVAGLPGNLVSQGVISQSQMAAIASALNVVLPHDVAGVQNAMQVLNLDSQSFIPKSNVEDYRKLEVVRTRTLEFGYKGVLAPGMVASIDLYQSEVSNFIGPFTVGTPNIFLESGSLNAYLIPAIRSALADPANASAAAALAPLDTSPGVLGNSDGDPSSELAFLVAAGVAGAIPFGTVTPVEAFDPTAVMLMRRNFGNVTVRGLDVNLLAFLSRQLRVGLMYSWMSDNYFRNVAGVDDISLNAPRHKGGGQIAFESEDGRLGFTLRGRYVQGYPVRSDVYVGTVEPFVVFDGSFHYEVPFSRNTTLNLTIQNLTDNRHREFVFVPEIGRLTLLRLTHEF
ncbi:MAG: TonB-dependent receptor [Bacteroidetes bacterium]|nr:TonB-dependent receptor [Bacteroidota bacterium]